MSYGDVASRKSSRSKEFNKLRDLILSASIVSSVAVSSDSVDDSLDSLSLFHYDIREADSLMHESNRMLSVESSVSFVVPSPAALSKDTEVSRLSMVRSSFASDMGKKQGIISCTQTVPSSDPEELKQLRSDLIPTLESEISIRDSHIAASSSAISTIISRLNNSLLLEPVRMRLVPELEWVSVFLALDSTSIDVFGNCDDSTPSQSFPLRTSVVRVSARLAELQLCSLKTHKASFRMDSSIRFKKILYVLKQAGISISVIDVPTDIFVHKQDSTNPRRTVRGD